MSEFDKLKNIVIVDDESIVTSSLRNLLVLETEYNHSEFNSPLEALEYLKIQPADLIISDFLMPGMNGINFLREAKKINPGATLILLTGYADKESAIKAINEIGIFRYIEKPWDNTDLLLSIKTGLERSHLIETLEQKIDELSKAKHKLENYNVELENIVKERTKELLKSNTDLESINRKLSGIINHCADGIVTVSKKGIISQINPVFKFLCGMTDFDILKNNFSDYFIDEINEPICSKFNPEKDILIRNYKILNKKTGKQIPVEISYAPITQENSAIEQYVCVIRNTTLQHEMDRLRDDFIATLTHDLRTPLLAAIQTLRFFLDGTLGQFDERQSKLLETMLNSNQDMLGLVNALLEVYKYESGQLVLFRDNFNLSELIHQCCSEIKSLIEKKLITLSINNQDNIEIYADKQELRRVLTNLLGNAFNYTPENGKISIIVESDKEFITVSVEDTGMGIPQEDIPKMFNRFSQGTSRKRSTGTGLGLYLSRQIIEAHGGKIWLESTVEKGSKFSFNIPINSEIINFTGFNNKSSNSC